MRAVAALALTLLACGGSPPPPPPKPEPPPPPTRVAVEDDEEPEDGVTIVNARGKMDPEVIDAGLSPHKEDLLACYTSRVGRRRWLGGKVSLKWDINKAGEVTSVKLAESDLGAWPIEKCLMEIARTATFGKPTGGDADFMVPLELGQGTAALWDETQALRAVGGQVGKLDECGKAKSFKTKTGKPIKGGRMVGNPKDVTVTLYVGPGGKAQSVGFSSATHNIDDIWADCAEKTALAWRLPDPKGQYAKLAVKYRP
ncbi:MAG TPA: AgmX/PglI C-terminal domain-containing protein [Kofleriaceae bacterium]|nr:AgmX/PglI C-terminal domain-containing protein [Kofleriaceae bacterium]